MITRKNLSDLGFRPIDLDHKTWVRAGHYCYCIPFTDVEKLKADFFRVEIRNDPLPVEFDPLKDWRICYYLDELEQSIQELSHYKNLRKSQGLLPPRYIEEELWKSWPRDYQ